MTKLSPWTRNLLGRVSIFHFSFNNGMAKWTFDVVYKEVEDAIKAQFANRVVSVYGPNNGWASGDNRAEIKGTILIDDFPIDDRLSYSTNLIRLLPCSGDSHDAPVDGEMPIRLTCLNDKYPYDNATFYYKKGNGVFYKYNKFDQDNFVHEGLSPWSKLLLVPNFTFLMWNHHFNELMESTIKDMEELLKTNGILFTTSIYTKKRDDSVRELLGGGELVEESLSYWTKTLLGLVTHIVIRKNFVDTRRDDELIGELMELFKKHHYTLILTKDPDDHMEFNGVISERGFKPRSIKKWMADWQGIQPNAERYPFMVMGMVGEEIIWNYMLGWIPGKEFIWTKEIIMSPNLDEALSIWTRGLLGRINRFSLRYRISDLDNITNKEILDSLIETLTFGGISIISHNEVIEGMGDSVGGFDFELPDEITFLEELSKLLTLDPKNAPLFVAIRKRLSLLIYKEPGEEYLQAYYKKGIGIYTEGFIGPEYAFMVENQQKMQNLRANYEMVESSGGGPHGAEDRTKFAPSVVSENLSLWTKTLLGGTSHFIMSWMVADMKEKNISIETIIGTVKKYFEDRNVLVMIGNPMLDSEEMDSEENYYCKFIIVGTYELYELGKILPEGGFIMNAGPDRGLNVWFSYDNNLDDMDSEYKMGMDIMPLLKTNEELSLWSKSLIGMTMMLYVHCYKSMQDLDEETFGNIFGASHNLISQYSKILDIDKCESGWIFYLDSWVDIEKMAMKLSGIPELGKKISVDFCELLDGTCSEYNDFPTMFDIETKKFER